ncbi:glycerate kinase [Acidiferrimicrobium sp. IK]|uniref:glycerate kinase family protein n=1 Tax=Acidiferrimicrobium sp. IK TaxID=2871700 RepID=UPI0021CB7146|nr:glycerate kinase [Acidiferrimicrobium sp. IK]MCU4186901.1 glycerate kinase [Acidiferrimicrobium sp. IK]
MHLVAAPDKFRGSATAGQVAAAIAGAARQAGWSCDPVPVSDGGEGFLDVFSGRLRTAVVRGPLGQPVEARWRMLDDDRTAVVETALASGLLLVGGAEGNDPVAADTTGTGQLIAEAVKAGARRVLVGVGGSATTDGGLGALAALEPHSRLRGIEVVVACDVETRFVDAAPVFAPQKGASPAQVELLTRRLQRLAGIYGPVIAGQPGSGAAGGLAGGLATVGATLVSGFEVVADVLDLAARIEEADLVVTGEGYLDEQSFAGKAVGGVAALAAEAGVPLVVVAGDGEDPQPVRWRSLVARAGAERAWSEPLEVIAEIIADELAEVGKGA